MQVQQPFLKQLRIPRQIVILHKPSLSEQTSPAHHNPPLFKFRIQAAEALHGSSEFLNAHQQIGRASCRERVYISVVDVSLYKNSLSTILLQCLTLLTYTY